MAEVEIYKIKKTAPPEVREYSVFDYMRSGETPNPLHYVREWAGEMQGTLPKTIPGRLMLNPPKGYHGGNIKNGDIAVVDGKPYMFDRLSGEKFVETDFDAAAVRDAVHVQYGWFVDAKGAEAISDNLAYVCEDIGIPCGYLGEQSRGGVYNDKRPFLPGASNENHLSFLHPDFMKGEEAQAFISLLSELTDTERWPEIFDYLRDHYPVNQQDLETARELFAPELLLPEELRPLAKRIPFDADQSELDYLSAKLDGMDGEQRRVFDAVIEAGWSCGSVAEIINLTENLNCFDIEPVHNVAEYGAYRLEYDWDLCEQAADRLEKSEDPADRALRKYITLLGRCADDETYGYHAAKEEGGAFTTHGFVREVRNLEEIYHGIQDIPAEYGRLPAAAPEFEAETNQPLVMLHNADLAALLLEMHAVGGDYMRDAKYNLQVLANGGEDFFIMVNAHSLTVTPADIAHHMDMAQNHAWMMADKTPDTRTFFMSVTERADGRITGNLCEVDLWTIQDNIRENSFYCTHLDAEMKDGTKRSFTPDEWDAMGLIERDKLKSWNKSYASADVARLASHIADIRAAYSENRQPLVVGEFLSNLNARYMAQAKNSQPDMLRVTLDAAKEILAQDAAHVFRLMKSGAEQLSPVNAAKANLWYSVDREFAVKTCDWAGIEKWAQGSAAEMLRQLNREQHKKSRGAEI